MNNKNYKAILYAIFAAILFGINAPISKVLLDKISPVLMASLLYFGAAIGMLVVKMIINLNKKEHNKKESFKKNQIKYIILMIVLDILAPIFLMIGINNTTSANASLLINFEIVATSIIALVIFKEIISKKLWVAIFLIVISSILLSFENFSSLSFSIGSIFVIIACICWGLENNCTKMLSKNDTYNVVIIKGFGSSVGSFIIAFIVGIELVEFSYVVIACLLGFVSYGLSIFFYVLSQRSLGAAKTSAFYAFAPFIGVTLSFFIFKDKPSIVFISALIIMIIGAILAAIDYHKHEHIHHFLVHEHSHCHDDKHHNHQHEAYHEEHNHIHTHKQIIHNHIHQNDLHHSHIH